jgi:hypothetical protein
MVRRDGRRKLTLVIASERECERCGGTLRCGSDVAEGDRERAAEVAGACRPVGGSGRPYGLAPLDRPWNQKETAYALGVSPSEVRKLTRRGDLPALPPIGRTVRYWPATVLKFRDGWRPTGMREGRQK